MTQSSSQQLFEKAQDLADEGRYEEALNLLLPLRDSRKPTANLEALIGSYYKNLGDLQSAVHHLKAATRLAPHFVAASLGLFHALWKMKRREAALEEARRFTALTGSDEYDEILEQYDISTVTQGEHTEDQERSETDRTMIIERDDGSSRRVVGEWLGEGLDAFPWDKIHYTLQIQIRPSSAASSLDLEIIAQIRPQSPKLTQGPKRAVRLIFSGVRSLSLPRLVDESSLDFTKIAVEEAHGQTMQDVRFRVYDQNTPMEFYCHSIEAHGFELRSASTA